ncbi:MAG: alpha/beta hydrolase [Clostridia bacterium]|nr:alpha/beta hydrolase [Clostridia bacterium]
MVFQEFGAENRQSIVLLHGGGLSWWNYRAEAERLQADYRVILPILDGHAGSGRLFASIEENAAELIAFIDDRLGGSVLLLGGLSLGAQVLLEMLAQRKDICRYALAESASVIPSGLTGALIGPAVAGSYGLVQSRSFARLQFASLHMDERFFEEYYRDTCGIAKADMIAFLKASTSYALKPAIAETKATVHALAGGKETRGIRRSLDLIREAIPSCVTSLLPGYRHGDFSINHPEEYVRYVKKMVGEG